MTLPKSTRRNGTLFAHVFVAKKRFMMQPDYTSHVVVPLTQYAVKEPEIISLLSGSANASKVSKI